MCLPCMPHALALQLEHLVFESPDDASSCSLSQFVCPPLCVKGVKTLEKWADFFCVAQAEGY